MCLPTSSCLKTAPEIDARAALLCGIVEAPGTNTAMSYYASLRCGFPKRSEIGNLELILSDKRTVLARIQPD